MILRVTLAALGAAFLVGCGPNCQSTCERIYDPGECGIGVPGEAWQRSVARCVSNCDYALDHPGEVGDYNPFEANTSGASIELTNEKQAAMWMDCVDQTACEDMRHGICAPI